jgi:DNA (cytosine-5)-methyltransferase 1
VAHIGLNSIELFTGAGGLSLGMSKAGFTHRAVVEKDDYCCDTIRQNQALQTPLVRDWPLYPLDVSEFPFSEFVDKVDVIAGGPPCQPFSLGGKHRGQRDSRNLFPAVFNAVRTVRPRAVLIENVKGLLRRKFADYVELITLQLSYPEIVQREGETWREHLKTLERYHTQGDKGGLRYNVVFRLLNASNYGVPQRRERVFFVAIRSDQNIAWSFPEATHSADGLLWDKWVTGDYWERHKITKRRRPKAPARSKNRIDRLRSEWLIGPESWRTVRDAISDLPAPQSRAAAKVANHKYIPGARSYKGHTGSPIDEPAKALKAGDHGVPGGENMVLDNDGQVRYFTVRESARIQTFPDDYIFHGTWTETMRQLGNAVPVGLAHAIAKDLRDKLLGIGSRD